ncbi:MAG: type I secretion system permease/ATPase [Halioglobus sp.]
MPHSTESSSRPDTGLQCLVLLARFHQVAADAAQIRHQFGQGGEVLDPGDLVRAARYLTLKARVATGTWDDLVTMPLPAIARHRDGHYFILAKMAGDKVLVQDPLEPRPQTLPKTLLAQSWTGELILITRRALLPGATGQFGFGWFIPAIARYRKHIGEVLLASLFIQLFALVTPLFFQVMIDKVLVHKGLSTLDVLALGLLVVCVFDVVLNGMRAYLLAHTSSRVDVSLGAQLFRHLLALPAGYFKARRVGDTVARVRELDTIRNFLTGSALTLVIDLFFTLVFFAVMYLYSPLLTSLVLGSLPFYVLLCVSVTPFLRSRLQEKFKRGAESQSFLVESVTGVETLKAMAVEPQLQRRWEELLAAYVTAGFRSGNLNNIASQAAGLIGKVVTVAILWEGATLVMEDALSVGQLIAFNMLAGRISAPILRLSQLWQEFQQAALSVQRLGDILNTPAESGHDPNRSTLPGLRGHVRFEHVSFRYQSERPDALDDVDLEFRAGEVVGIVGRSGSGKSTLAKLLQRLYVPDRGRITVDGVDIALVQPAWLRRQVGVVLQDSFLFNRSVKENIALTDPGAPVESVMQVARMAGAHEFIVELPQGYDTVVGEQASLLSGGQKQRLAIARALLNGPRILILDEATSALDYESERIIRNNMQAICADRTVLIIAHRLSTLRTADRIIVLDRGRVIEQGTHRELLCMQGQYAHLHALQLGAGVA